MSTLRITGSSTGIGTRILIDRKDISRSVTRATLRLDAREANVFEVEFMGLENVSELGAEVRYLAWGAGHSAMASDMPTALRLLADAIEADLALVPDE